MIFQMNFAQALKCPLTRGSMLNSMHSRAEVELGHKLSKDEISKLAQKFSLDYVFYASEKVILYNKYIISYIFRSPQFGFGSLKFMLFLCKNPNLNCKFSLTATPRDGNCLLHAIIDGVLNNEAFKHSNNMVEADSWRQLLFKLGLFNANVDEGQKIQFLRNRWVLGASQWLAGKNGSKENDKIILGYSDQEWEYIWATMIENGAWALGSAGYQRYGRKHCNIF